MASVLFSPIALRRLTLPNRVVVSPMCQYNSNNGSANDWHLMHLGSFSLGCAGLVMCEMTNVNPIGRISPKCAGMYSDDNEMALKRVHDFCRTYGVAKLGVPTKISLSLQGVQLACHGCVVLCLVGACRRRTPAPAHDEDRGDEDHHTPQCRSSTISATRLVPLQRRP